MKRSLWWLGGAGVLAAVLLGALVVFRTMPARGEAPQVGPRPEQQSGLIIPTPPPMPQPNLPPTPTPVPAPARGDFGSVGEAQPLNLSQLTVEGIDPYGFPDGPARWEVQGEEVVQRGNRDGRPELMPSIAVFPELTWTEGTLAAEVWVGVGPDAGLAYVLEDGTYYLLRVIPRFQKVVLDRYDGTRTHILAEAPVPARVNLGDWVALELTVRGDRIEGAVEGIGLISVPLDAPLAAGRPGLFAYALGDSRFAGLTLAASAASGR